MNKLKYTINDEWFIEDIKRAEVIDRSFQKYCFMNFFIFFATTLTTILYSSNGSAGIGTVLGAFILTIFTQLLFVEVSFRKHFYNTHKSESVLTMRDKYLAKYGFKKAFRHGQYKKDDEYYYFNYPVITDKDVTFEIEVYDYNKHDCEP